MQHRVSFGLLRRGNNPLEMAGTEWLRRSASIFSGPLLVFSGPNCLVRNQTQARVLV
jgi:hypothetical protein